MQDLNDLAYFAAVADHGGFAPASRALGVPKSKLSRRVALLEERLGVRLLHRTTRRFAITETGEAFLRHCHAMLAEAEAAEALIAEQSGSPRGVVHLSCPPALLHAAVGDMLARAHLAARDYELRQPNLRGLAWWNETVPVILPHLDESQAALIRAELAYQNHTAASSAYAALPRGAVHADLFRDNVMFEGTPEQPVLSGFFDFYFAGVDTWLFDLAVTLNDWAIDLPTGATHVARTQALLNAYQAVRPLTDAERRLLPAMLRAGALRFWVSRLWDFHLPREASMLKAHDPGHFERVLRQRLAAPLTA